MDWSLPKDSWLFAAHLPTLSITQGGLRRIRGMMINNDLERKWEEWRPGELSQCRDYARLDSPGSESRRGQIFYL